MNDKYYLSKEQIEEAMLTCTTRQDLANYFNVSLSTIKRRLKEYGLSTFKRVFDENKFKELYNKGLTDAGIAKILGCSNGTITNYRNRLGLSSNFKYGRDEQIEECKELHKTKSISEIANMLELPEIVIEYFLNEPDLPLTEDELTNSEYQIIIGSLLGDGSIAKNKSGNLGQLRYAHSSKQAGYCIWKTEQLKRLMYFETPFKSQERFDPRTQKLKFSHYAISKETKFFKQLHDRWYYVNPSVNERIKNIKHICKEDLYRLDGLGLAIWFMDDGYHEDSGYLLCTQCFSNEDLLIIQDYFKTRWNIEVTIRKNKEIYIPSKYRNQFEEIIRPYIHENCAYKILNK